MPRPKKEVTPRELRPLDQMEIAEIAPIVNGRPDLHNYIPTRLIPRDEAKTRGWPLFYEAQPCRYGHIAPRYVSNPRLCVDCNRTANGRQPIGGRAGGNPEYQPRPYKQRQPSAIPPGASPPKPIEPDGKEKAFLEKYAYTKDLQEACKAANLSQAQVESRIAYSAVFRDAVNALEERLGIKKTIEVQESYEWTRLKKDRLIEIYVDTGDLASARDSIRVTPSEYFRELERDEDFAERVKLSEAFASRALEERAVQLALAGNDKLLTKILSAKIPEYRERVSMDMNVTEKLDDRQLDSRLARLLGRAHAKYIEGAFVEVDEERETPAISGPRTAGEEES